MSLLVTVVEGQSEARALNVLLRRMLVEQPGVKLARPFRVRRSKVVRAGELEKSLAQAVRSRPGASALLLLLDADEDCAAEVGPELLARATACTDIPTAVVLPCVEIECWILAAIESVRGVRGVRASAGPPDDPEAVRDAKGALTRLMDGTRGYVATDDMPALFASLDWELAQARSRSADKFVREVARLTHGF